MSTIPYDPSLVLGSIVSSETITRLQDIAKLESTVSKAHATLNSYIMLKRKLDMTCQDLVSLSVPVDDLMDSMHETSKKIQKAAIEYSRVASVHLPEIAEKRADISGIHQSCERTERAANLSFHFAPSPPAQPALFQPTRRLTQRLDSSLATSKLEFNLFQLALVLLPSLSG